jgi:hypothetical protein
MKKLSLDLDALQVESFDASPPPAERRGTVRGNDSCPVLLTTEAVDDCGPVSGRPCVEFEATPLSLCDEYCVVPSNPCE